MRWKHIIWDWNGTLINDVGLCLQIINNVLSKYKKPTMTLAQYHQFFDFPVKEYYRRIGFDFEQTPFEQVGTEFMQQYWDRWRDCRLHEGVEALVRELAGMDVPQAIISAAETRLVLDGLSFYNLSGLFDNVLGLDHYYASSKEALVVNFVESIETDSGEVLFIGDTLHDFEVARQAGVDCILFSGGHHSQTRLQACGVPVFNSYQDIRAFLLHHGDA